MSEKKECKHNSMQPSGYAVTSNYAMCIVEFHCSDCDYRDWDFGEVTGDMKGV